LLHDRPGWPNWSSLGRYEHVSGVEGELGAVCVFVTSGMRSVERIVELVPGQRLSYVLESGLPMRDYRADVDLVPAPNPDGSTGTDITWCSTFRPAIRGTGWLFRAMVRQIVGRMSASLATTAATATASAR
jgi:hypothetical protein